MDRKVSVRRRVYRKPWIERCKDYLRTFLAFMFSNVGIVGVVVGYVVAGAVIFRTIEKPAAEQVRTNLTMARNAIAVNIWKITSKTNVLEGNMWKANVTVQLLHYSEIVVNACKDGYDGVYDDNEIYAWSFPSGFMYSLTVITTIGYGNVFPRTPSGKIVTIIYAIIGMPLFLLYLSNIGDIMARSFKWLYAKLCLCRCCPGVARKREERQRKRAAELSVEYYGNQDGSESPEVSIRDLNTQSNSRVTYGIREATEDDEEHSNESLTEISYDSQTVTVPLTVCLSIMAGYILGGALFFTAHEKEWTILDASYFCFISLSTIGFGDFVPGNAISSKNSFDNNAIYGAMYLMLGMALIAMCFNLMQVRWLTFIAAI